MPMVKANAYGQGMVEVAHELKDMAPAYGVACIEEALSWDSRVLNNLSRYWRALIVLMR